MNVSLTPDLERFVNDSIASGQYETAFHVLREALQLLEGRDRARWQLHADVQAGLDQLARGESRAYDKSAGRQLAERIKSRGLRRAPRSRSPHRSPP